VSGIPPVDPKEIDKEPAVDEAIDYPAASDLISKDFIICPSALD